MKSIEILLSELKKANKKYIYEVDYYQRKNLINYKIIYADNAAEAIKKARVKNIIDLQILNEE